MNQVSFFSERYIRGQDKIRHKISIAECGFVGHRLEMDSRLGHKEAAAEKEATSAE